MRYVFACTVVIWSLMSCAGGKKDYKKVLSDPLLYSRTVNQLTEVITHDIFTPPPAARIHAYASLAAYEVIAQSSRKYPSLQGKVNGLKDLPKAPTHKINVHLAALLAFMDIGQTFTFSKDSTQKIIDNLKNLAADHGIPDEELKSSVAYANAVSRAVLAWSKHDNYAQTRSAARYTVNNDEGRWVPTPPGYMQAAEPAWMNIRPIFLDSAAQFLAPPPTPYSRDTTSKFHKLVTEVYTVGKTLTDEQKAIADFWDCNGFKLHVSGHVMYATKAMTPGGHWMGITGAVAAAKDADFEKTVFTYAAVSAGVFDGFITCWNTKFHWNLLRPETYINKYMDQAWMPYLQTPPFPEYTSGHSVISSASATILSKIYGDDVAFTDSTERAWGWPDRKYTSVKQAAVEASMSRLYGGIHYREALDVGLAEGEKVGNWVLGKFEIEPSQSTAAR